MVSTILIFLLFLVPLVFFHELGHFLFAKYYKVRVEAFSIGFGPKIFQYKWGETTYAISLIPLGGYVKMYGDNILERDQLSEAERSFSFTHKTRWQRFWIVFGGPLANFLMAFVIFWGIFVSGETVPEPRLGVVFPETEFYRRGLRSGDMLIGVNGKALYSTFDIAAIGEDEISFLSVSRGGQEIDVRIGMTKTRNA